MLSDEHQYKALRDEILSNFTRIYTLLCAELTVGAAILWRVTSSSLPSERSLLLLLLQILIVIGIFMTRSFYNDIFKISAYIVIFLEGRNSPGWENRVLKLDSLRLNRKKAKEIGLPFSPLESSVSILIYTAMAIVSLVVGFFEIGLPSNVVNIMIAISSFTLFLIIWFRWKVPKLAGAWTDVWSIIKNEEDNRPNSDA